MNHIASTAEELSGLEEALCWVLGAGFTLALFLGEAYVQHAHPDPPSAAIHDLAVAVIPLDPPPPPRAPKEVVPPPPDEAVALTGFDLEPSDSPVKIAVVPPDLEQLVPTTQILPGSVTRLAYLDSPAKPHVNASVDVHHVYQLSEVDQRPRAVVQAAPALWPRAYDWGPTLSVTLLIGIDATGRVETALVLRSSGHEEYDKVVVQTVKDQWLFSPAIRRGRKVRCLVEQKITVIIGSVSAFEVH